MAAHPNRGFYRRAGEQKEKIAMPRWTTRLTAAVVLAGSTSIVPLAQTPAPPPHALRVVEAFDLTQFAGTWYEIARLPNSAQRRCARDVVARYGRRTDGRIDVLNTCIDEDGKRIDIRRIGRAIGAATSSPRWSIRSAPALLSFLPGGWRDYWIIGRGPEYTWAVAGTPSRQGLWILSRLPEMSASSYEQALVIAKGNGFDVNRLIKTAQTPR
jgi:apolipoprotein D and lipocalin family protein